MRWMGFVVWMGFVFLLALLPLAARSADWTDRKEYDLVLTIRAEAAPQRQLELLDAWSKTYPNSDLKEARLELYLSAYRAMGDRARIFDTAQQILTLQDTNPVGLYWCAALLPTLDNPSVEKLDAGEKSARRIVSGAKVFFAPDKKPPSITDAEWQQQRASVEVLAHRTLGWAHWQRGEFSAAEDEFTICLQQDPNDAEASAWLGMVLAIETGKEVPALWQLARGSTPQEKSDMSDSQRREVNTVFEQLYLSYHGTSDGIDDLRKTAASAVFPPAGFNIDPASVVAAVRAEQELSQTNPELAAWVAMRARLEAPGGENYFTSTVQAKLQPRLKGTVLHATPARGAREVSLSMDDSGTPQVDLKLSAPMPRYLPPGSKIAFYGTGESFTKVPFAVEMSADPKAVEVLSTK
jgi:tetratricopeptide (TPR) repeat protein